MPRTLRNAIPHSLGANSVQGLRRSKADKRKAAETILANSEWAKWTHTRISEACGVSREFVTRVFCEQKPKKDELEIVIGSQNDEPDAAPQQDEQVVIGSQAEIENTAPVA